MGFNTTPVLIVGWTITGHLATDYLIANQVGSCGGEYVVSGEEVEIDGEQCTCGWGCWENRPPAMEGLEIVFVSPNAGCSRGEWEAHLCIEGVGYGISHEELMARMTPDLIARGMALAKELGGDGVAHVYAGVHAP